MLFFTETKKTPDIILEGGGHVLMFFSGQKVYLTLKILEIDGKIDFLNNGLLKYPGSHCVFLGYGVQLCHYNEGSSGTSLLGDTNRKPSRPGKIDDNSE
jgi:hypothetical protein